MSGTTAEQTATIGFADINEIPGQGVTFEIGRQYVLHLDFADLLGSRITFNDIDSDVYSPDIDVPRVNQWAKSNVYWDGTKLTFSENDASKSGYQGLYFKWGSLIGVSSGHSTTNGDFDADSYLYIPDLSTGKYYKVKVSDIRRNRRCRYFNISYL